MLTISARVMAVGENTITINLNGGQGAISDTSAHTFVSATTDGILDMVWLQVHQSD